ncbi:MAG: type I restriction enzyme HsdR N-terminal domain-containing protein [Alistipes sp.]|nr:type I restriction enzyme HsdR N-terminal domain-containing protein [Alistipes sp.]
MPKASQINFPAIDLNTKVIDGQQFVWDALRRKYLLLTPEERVRRHAIAFLISHCGVLPQSIAQEYPVTLNGTAQRADIVVVGNDLAPVILVECKAPEVNITEQVWSQAVRYNAVLKARYIILTNGHKHLCAELTAEGYRRLPHFPKVAY